VNNFAGIFPYHSDADRAFPTVWHKSKVMPIVEKYAIRDCLDATCGRFNPSQTVREEHFSHQIIPKRFWYTLGKFNLFPNRLDGVFISPVSSQTG